MLALYISSCVPIFLVGSVVFVYIEFAILFHMFPCLNRNPDTQRSTFATKSQRKMFAIEQIYTLYWHTDISKSIQICDKSFSQALLNKEFTFTSLPMPPQKRSGANCRWLTNRILTAKTVTTEKKHIHTTHTHTKNNCLFFRFESFLYGTRQ